MGSPTYNDPVESAKSWESLEDAVEAVEVKEVLGAEVSTDDESTGDVNATESH